jgi:hypothetical protein
VRTLCRKNSGLMARIHREDRLASSPYLRGHFPSRALLFLRYSDPAI